MPQGMTLTRSGVRRAAALAAAALAVLVPAGEASAQGWFDGPAFAGPHDLSTVFAEAPDGSVTTVWTGTEIDLQHAAPDGTVGPVEQIADDATNIPVLAVGPSGSGAVVWSVPHAPGSTVPLKVTLVRADGTPGRTDQVGPIDGSTPVVAVDAAGDAIVAWSAPGAGGSGSVVAAAHVAPGGIVRAIPLAGASRVPGDSPQVAVAPDGTAWIGWVDPAGTPNPTERVERVAPDGTPGPDAAVSNPATNVFSPVLVASAAGGVAMWSGGGSAAQGLRGVRLPTTGAGVAGDPLPLDTIDPADDRTVLPVVPALGPDGAISVLWTEASGTSSTSVILSRIPAGGTVASAQTLATSPDTGVTGWPQLAATSDGTLLAEWIEMPSDPGSATTATVRAARIGADGTIAPATTAGTLTFPTSLGILAAAFAQPFADTAGGGLVKLLSIDGGITATVSLRRLDAAGPAVTADVPATAVAGVPITLSATASDRSGATVAWDFGDGGRASGGSVQHAYAAPGTYAVTVTATDGAQNDTVVRKQLTVTAPAVPVDPPAPAPPGRAIPAPPAVRKAAATLKVTKASRTGAKVTVSGTIAKAASGKITITYAVKVGRKTVTKKVTARIAKGRWSASFKLTGKLASKAAAGHATVTVTYAGNGHTAKATAKHTVRTTAPAHRAPAKRKG
jgi:PKD repeat protein